MKGISPKNIVKSIDYGNEDFPLDNSGSLERGALNEEGAQMKNKSTKTRIRASKENGSVAAESAPIKPKWLVPQEDKMNNPKPCRKSHSICAHLDSIRAPKLAKELKK